MGSDDKTLIAVFILLLTIICFLHDVSGKIYAYLIE